MTVNQVQPRVRRKKREDGADKSRDYIDNKKLTEEVAKYSSAYRLAKANGTELPRQSNYIGDAILKIANRLATSWRFNRYHRDDFIEAASIGCVKYLHNFNPEKTNAFSYITTICFNTFIEVIKSEKKQMKIKAKMIRQSGIIHDLASHQDSDDSETKNYLQYLLDSLDQKDLEEFKQEEPSVVRFISVETYEDVPKLSIDQFNSGETPTDATV